MARLLSRFSAPAVLLCAFTVFAGAVAGLYLALRAEPPPGYVLLYAAGFVWAFGWWMRDDSRRRGVRWVWVSDLGLFIYITWPFVLLYYLFKTRGAKASLTILAFCGAYIMSFLGGAALGALLSVNSLHGGR
jgi:hypothetical protein